MTIPTIPAEEDDYEAATLLRISHSELDWNL